MINIAKRLNGKRIYTFSNCYVALLSLAFTAGVGFTMFLVTKGIMARNCGEIGLLTQLQRQYLNSLVRSIDKLLSLFVDEANMHGLIGRILGLYQLKK